MLLALFNGHAMAAQYGDDSPNPYSTPAAYPYPHARAPYAYYPVYRYPPRLRPVPAYTRPPAQTPADNTANTSAEQRTANRSSIAVKVKTEMPETADLSGSVLSGKKQAFITTLLPAIEKENRRLLALRESVSGLLGKLDRNIALDASEQKYISRLANRYRVKQDPLVDLSAREELLRKIDIIPPSLALAQAANESAWGQSRFARQANNLFGIWTYDQDKGLKPERREEGKTHLVRIFDDFSESVRYYMHTLNSHPAYHELRVIRQQLRAANQVIEGRKLATGLENYSAKGEAYIVLIQSLIQQNQWVRLDNENHRV